MEKRKELWRALPFVMAMLLLTLVPMQSADALFGRGKEEVKAADGAPVAENLTIKVYRGVPYEGAFRAVDNEGDEMTFAIAQEPKKGSVALTEDGLGFVYTPGGKLGSDSFTYTASDACGNTSLPATRIGDSYFFEPERTLSRGEFVAMALAAMDVSAEDVQMTGFCDDAGIPTWAKGYAVSALNAGVVSGVSTAEGVAFRANDAISLNEAAVVLNRLLRVTDVDLSDYDAQDAENAWCAQAVANLQSVSVIESGRFSADEMRSGVTRAQAAEMLSAAMTLKDGRAEKGGLLSGIFG